MFRHIRSVALLGLGLVGPMSGSEPGDLHQEVIAAMKKSAKFYRSLAVHGGYVYHTTLDPKVRWGEGLAGPQQIWVQPPATPTVGLAYLAAYRATGDTFYLDAANDAAEALAYGQLKSGGWTNSIDFDPRGQTALYRNGKGRGKNNSSLDDGQTQSALRLLIQADQANKFENETIHEAATVGLEALLAAQFPNGAFPQVWTGPIQRQPIVKASYPDYDWRTEGRIKEYWNMYTLNDNVCGYVAQTLIDAHRVYGDEKYRKALAKLGDFLLLAQMPEPQPGWAQQYNYDMKPIWARKFEPAAIAGDETQEVIETLMLIATTLDDDKYLKPIPSALAYLKRSLLKDGRLARYYELKTNKPLYMGRDGKKYYLTYDDSKLPKHYGWKTEARVAQLEAKYNLIRLGRSPTVNETKKAREARVRKILDELDEKGRWVSVHKGEGLVGQPKIPVDSEYLSSAVFSEHLELLSDYLTTP